MVVTSKWELMAAFVQRRPITLGASLVGPRTTGGVTGIISKLEHEDGSGNCYNVTFEHDIKTMARRTVFVRVV